MRCGADLGKFLRVLSFDSEELACRVGDLLSGLSLAVDMAVFPADCCLVLGVRGEVEEGVRV